MSVAEFIAGGRKSSGDYAGYITRADAADIISFFNLDHLAAENLDEARVNAMAYAETRQEIELAKDKKGRTHYRMILSYPDKVASATALDDAQKLLQRHLSDARAVIAIHQDTDNTHPHVWIDSRKTDGEKIHLNIHQLEAVSDGWTLLYDETYGTNYAPEYRAKKEEKKRLKAKKSASEEASDDTNRSSVRTFETATAHPSAVSSPVRKLGETGETSDNENFETVKFDHSYWSRKEVEKKFGVKPDLQQLENTSQPPASVKTKLIEHVLSIEESVVGEQIRKAIRNAAGVEKDSSVNEPDSLIKEPLIEKLPPPKPEATDFVKELKRQKIFFNPNIQKSGKIVGASFAQADSNGKVISFKGSDLGDEFKWSAIAEKIEYLPERDAKTFRAAKTEYKLALRNDDYTDVNSVDTNYNAAKIKEKTENLDLIDKTGEESGIGSVEVKKYTPVAASTNFGGNRQVSEQPEGVNLQDSFIPGSENAVTAKLGQSTDFPAGNVIISTNEITNKISVDFVTEDPRSQIVSTVLRVNEVNKNAVPLIPETTEAEVANGHSTSFVKQTEKDPVTEALPIVERVETGRMQSPPPVKIPLPDTASADHRESALNPDSVQEIDEYRQQKLQEVLQMSFNCLTRRTNESESVARDFETLQRFAEAATGDRTYRKANSVQQEILNYLQKDTSEPERRDLTGYSSLEAVHTILTVAGEVRRDEILSKTLLSYANYKSETTGGIPALQVKTTGQTKTTSITRLEPQPTFEPAQEIRFTQNKGATDNDENRFRTNQPNTQTTGGFTQRAERSTARAESEFQSPIGAKGTETEAGGANYGFFASAGQSNDRTGQKSRTDFGESRSGQFIFAQNESERLAGSLPTAAPDGDARDSAAEIAGEKDLEESFYQNRFGENQADDESAFRELSEGFNRCQIAGVINVELFELPRLEIYEPQIAPDNNAFVNDFLKMMQENLEQQGREMSDRAEFIFANQLRQDALVESAPLPAESQPLPEAFAVQASVETIMPASQSALQMESSNRENTSKLEADYHRISSLEDASMKSYELNRIAADMEQRAESEREHQIDEGCYQDEIHHELDLFQDF